MPSELNVSVRISKQITTKTKNNAKKFRRTWQTKQKGVLGQKILVHTPMKHTTLKSITKIQTYCCTSTRIAHEL